MTALFRGQYLLLLVCMAGNSFFGAAQTAWTVYDTGNSDLPNNTVRSVAIDSLNHVWAGTDQGLAEFDGTNWNVYQTSNSGLPGDEVRAINVDRNGELWVGTFDDGLAHFDGVNWTVYNTSNSGLSSNNVKTIAFDSQNDLWVGTAFGLSWRNDTGWVSWTVFNSNLFTNNIGSVQIDDNDVKFIGTVNGGLSIMPASNDTFFLFTSFNSNLIDNTLVSLALDQAGLIWAATPAAGLLAHDGNSQMVAWLGSSNSSNPTDACRHVLVDQNGIKHVATQNEGYLTYNDVQFDVFNTSTSDIPNDELFMLALADQGVVWMGSAGSGLIRYDKALSAHEMAYSKWEVYPSVINAGKELTINGLQNQKVHGYLIDPLGKVVWQGLLSSTIKVPAQLSAGLYTLSLVAPEQRHSVRILIVD